MRLLLHILRKDIRYLWWETAVTLLVLAALSHMDAQRADAVPGSTEGLLQLLLPVAWCYLIAMLIQSEALVGDRQFWLTRPYPRSTLLGAKVAFIILLIHVPAFIADAAIVEARGFRFYESLPSLLLKQILMAGILTIPAAALAAVTRNIAQFMIAIVALAAAAAFFGPTMSAPWLRPDRVRQAIAVFVACSASVFIVIFMYRRRQTGFARAMGIGAIALIVMGSAYLPPSTTAALHCAISPGPAYSIRFVPDGLPLPLGRVPHNPTNAPVFAIPVRFDGVPEGRRVLVETLELELTAPDGRTWRMAPPPRRLNVQWELIIQGFFQVSDERSAWLTLTIAPDVWSAVRGKPVSISARTLGRTYVVEPVTSRPSVSEPAPVAAVGRCSSQLVSDWRSGSLLKAMCESADRLPAAIGVRLVNTETQRTWNHRLGDAGTHMGYPTWSWLSPIERKQTFFHVVPEAPDVQGAEWLVPSSMLEDATLQWMPETEQGCRVERWSVRNVDLARFTVVNRR
jgi:hypothetical protein